MIRKRGNMIGARNGIEEWNEQIGTPPNTGSAINKEHSKYTIKILVDMQDIDIALEKFREMERIYDKIHKLV